MSAFHHVSCLFGDQLDSSLSLGDILGSYYGLCSLNTSIQRNIFNLHHPLSYNDLEDNAIISLSVRFRTWLKLNACLWIRL